jgi:histidine triad (HIT) family protein
MTTHEPPGYDCPFCRLVRGVETERNRLDDVVYRDNETTAFVSPKWWPGNEGHAIVVPVAHVENLYAIPPDLLAAVYATVQRVAVAIRATYGCAGTSTRQHNEPGGAQDVWHFHVHVFPRWAGDELYANDAQQRWAGPEERAPYAARLRGFLDNR